MKFNKNLIMEKPNNNELNELLGKPFKVLNDGFIRVVDYMGSDESIVQAARVSYGKGTKKVNKDQGLIRYLIRNRHTSPFEMCEIKFHIRVPMDCWRQWIRHRTASVNEYSTRYSEAINSRQKTFPEEWRGQDIKNKQSSSGFLSKKIGQGLSKQEEELHKTIEGVYENRLKLGVSREQARKDLPLSTYTEAYWKIDLHNLLHFLELRMDHHAQLEIRTYANIIGYEIVKKWCPFVWDAFIDYRLNALSFSRTEQIILNEIIHGNQKKAIEIASKNNFVKINKKNIKRSFECIEFENKLRELCLLIPWLE